MPSNTAAIHIITNTSCGFLSTNTALKPGMGWYTGFIFKRIWIRTQVGSWKPCRNCRFHSRFKYYDKLYKREINGWKSYLHAFLLALVRRVAGFYFTDGKSGCRYRQSRLLLCASFNQKYLNTTEPINEKFRVKNRVRIDQRYFDPVIDGMQLAVEAGTARAAVLPGITVCGKTGTSQNRGKDHSVFLDSPRATIQR